MTRCCEQIEGFETDPRVDFTELMISTNAKVRQMILSALFFKKFLRASFFEEFLNFTVDGEHGRRNIRQYFTLPERPEDC